MKCVAAFMLFCVAAAVADIKFGVVPNTKRGVVPNTKTSVVPNTKTSVFPNNKPGDVIDTKPGVIPVLQRTEVRDEVGQYSLSYLSGDGTALTEQGALKPNAENDGHVLVKQGSISYTSPEGIPISYKYVADENGFRPEGAHIPVPVSA